MAQNCKRIKQVFHIFQPLSNVKNSAFPAAFLLCLALSFACSRAVCNAQETKPNILWINAEDMSPHLGCYGHPDGDTPNIDHLSKSGVVYRNAFATAPICSPARSCLATGLYATSLGTQHLRCDVKIPAKIVPLAVRLRKLGYFCTNTGKSDYNFDPKGIWDAWNQKPAPWRARKKGQPFFAFITIGETHEGRINFRDRYLEATRNLAKSRRHDPTKVQIPPFYPDTPDIRRIFAGMYDLASVFDDKVGEIVEQLKTDGDFENTVIFIFGDHGNGLPRYKRWLCDSGLRVPLVVHVPKKFQTLCPHPPGTQTDRLVSFVDFPTTAVSLAGGGELAELQGKPFLGNAIGKPRKFVFGARSRADDMFEVSRSVSDGRYIYIKHFLPHLPYIQDSVIFGDEKDSFRVLRKLFQERKLDEHALKLWASRKPVEELYDLEQDPHELVNLAKMKDYSQIKSNLAGELKAWILKSRDSGFLPESYYQMKSRSQNRTPYEFFEDPFAYELESILEVAWQVGDETPKLDLWCKSLEDDEPGVQYWAVTAIMDAALRGKRMDRVKVSQLLKDRLTSEVPCVSMRAAEALLSIHTDDVETIAKSALKQLGRWADDDRPWVSLEASRAIALLGSRSQPLVPTMKKVIGHNRSAPGSRRPYKDFNYASFTGWALETALRKCGENEFVDQIYRKTK